LDDHCEESLGAADDLSQALRHQAVVEADQKAQEIQIEVLGRVPGPVSQHDFQPMEDLQRVRGGGREGGRETILHMVTDTSWSFQQTLLVMAPVTVSADSSPISRKSEESNASRDAVGRARGCSCSAEVLVSVRSDPARLRSF
jgi:hypothetical protein